MDERNYCVYVHINKINGKRYYGLTRQEPAERWRNGKGYKGSTHFENAIKKYGWENFDHIVLMNNLTKEEACAAEKNLIEAYQTQDERYGYNLESGGEAPTHSQETKEKLRQIFSGRTFSEETLLRMKEAARKRGGHTWSEESKEKIRKTKTGHPVSEETRTKLKKASSKPVKCIELNIVFPSMKEAAEYFNGCKATVCAVINGRNKTAYGYHWQLVDN